MNIKKILAFATMAVLTGAASGAGYPKMWVMNNYPMKDPAIWPSVSNMVVRAAAVGYNGLLTGNGLENAMNGWNKKSLALYEKLRDLCAQLDMEIIPSVWGLGYGGPVCFWDAEVVEGTLMKDLVYVSDGKKLRFEPQPISDREFAIADFGVKPVVARLKPYHHYRITFKIKTENMFPDIYYKFRISCYQTETKESQLFDPPLKPTQDWTDVEFAFDTYESGAMKFYAGKGNQKVLGSYQVKDVKIEECGPCRMLTTDGMAPVLRDARTGLVYEAGRDYVPLGRMKRFRTYPNDKSIAFDLPAGSRIAKGAKVLVECWKPAVVGHRQHSGCPSAEGIYRYDEQSARKIQEFFRPKTWLLGVDEWRVANRCKRCQARNMSPAELIAECTRRQYDIIRKVNPNAQIAAWADMFAPTDNARNHYYCVKGDITGVWNLIPKDILMVVWENGHGPVALKHFSDNGFQTLAGAYYDFPTLDNDRKWLESCNATPGCQGLMYTTWEQKYGLLEDFADMVKKGGVQKPLSGN
jgi:hypothetical protein